jgi:hypothetical protein
VHIERNAVDIFRVDDAGVTIGSTANAANIKAVEVGTCTHPGGNVTNWTCGAGNTSGITTGSLTAADAISINGRAYTNTVTCSVTLITAGTSFTVRCSANPGNSQVFNVLIVRP